MLNNENLCERLIARADHLRRAGITSHNDEGLFREAADRITTLLEANQKLEAAVYLMAYESLRREHTGEGQAAILQAASSVPYLRENYRKIADDLEDIALEIDDDANYSRGHTADDFQCSSESSLEHTGEGQASFPDWCTFMLSGGDHECGIRPDQHHDAAIGHAYVSNGKVSTGEGQVTDEMVERAVSAFWKVKHKTGPTWETVPISPMRENEYRDGMRAALEAALSAASPVQGEKKC